MSDYPFPRRVSVTAVARSSMTRLLWPCACLGAFLAGFLAAAWVCATSQRTEQPSPADSLSVPGQYPTWPFQPLTTGGTTAPPADQFTVWNSPDAARGAGAI